MKSKIPVFDVGDSILPDHRLMNEAVKAVLQEEGNSDIPRFPIHEYNIFRPGEVSEFLLENDLQANPVDIRERYEEKAAKFLAEDDIMPTLDRISHRLGTIGFISDNSVREKEFMQEMLRKHKVEYEGYVVSEEAGAEKPSEEIFRSFTRMRREKPERFAYFGNHVSRDQGCRKIGMDFVWVKQYNTFGSRWEGPQIDKITFDAVKEKVKA